MTFGIETEEVFNKTEDYIHLEVDPTDEGVKIYVRSPQVEALFKRLNKAVGGLTHQDPTTDLECYQIPLDGVPILDQCTFGAPGSPLIMEPGPTLNLTFLTAVGIGKGVTFTMKGVFPTNWYNSLEVIARKGLRELFQNYLKPTSLKMKLTTSVVQ